MKKKIKISSSNRFRFCLKCPLTLVAFVLLSMGLISAQGNESTLHSKTIIGIVRDAHTKQPISAAQINLFDKSASASTDGNGVFKIKVKSSSEVIVVSAYDYGRRDIALQGRDSLVIDLYSDVFENYYKSINTISNKVDNSNLISSVKGTSDLSQITSVSIDDVLQSQFGADVRSVSRSGLAGMGSSLFIRGLSSIFANVQPLFVIDGVIWNNLYDMKSIQGGFWNNPLDNIDITDIESISIIKDGTSIYGSKAANGVVLIKTKRGKGTVTKICANITNGVTSIPGTIPMMNGDQFRIYASELLNSAGLAPSLVPNMSFLQYDKTKLSYNAYHNNTDWAKEVYQEGTNKNYTLNVSGGDENALYYLSVGYTGNTGIVKTTSLDRINTIFNADITLSPQFTLGANIGFSSLNRVLIDDGVNFYTSPTWLSKIKAPFFSPFSYTDAGVKSLDYATADDFGIGNPYGIILNSLNKTKEYRFNVGITPTYQITKDLKISSQFDYSLNKYTERNFRPMGVTEPIIMTDLSESDNMLSSQVMLNNSIFSDTRLTWSKVFDQNHHFNVIAGCRYLNNIFESDYAEGHNTGSNNVTTLSGGLKYLNVSGANDQSISTSNYVSADYNFANKYFLNLSSSLDGSSRFGNWTMGGVKLFGNSWGLFPSTQAGWLISSEPFMKNLPFINMLKLRGGFGLTGNDDIKDSQNTAYFTSVSFMGRANGLVISNIENPQIQWETTRRANVGIDMNLFNERLSLSIDAYSSITSDLLTLKSLPEITGGDFYWTNDGKLSNKGIEVSADVKILNRKEFKWEMGVSAGHYVNKILALPENGYSTSVYGGEIRTAVGESVGSFFGYKTLGVFSTEAEASKADKGTGFLKMMNTDGSFSNFQAGDIHFVDTDHNGVIDNNDKQIIGNPNPILYGTASTKLSYKRVTLDVLFTYSYGNSVYNYQRSQLEGGDMLYNQSTVMLNRWTVDGQQTSQPRAIYGDLMGNARFSDRWIEDGSYLRLKTVSLSYDIPLKLKFIESFNIWISANNLYTFTKYLGLDPEFSAGNSTFYQGIDTGRLPLTKSYYVGLKINL